MNKVKPMKKMIFSSLAILAVSATLSHAGNIASSTQSGPYAASASVSQSGDNNAAVTSQSAGNAFASDSVSVNQNGFDNSAVSIQSAVDSGNGVGNNDTINQNGDANIATTVSVGDANTTTVNQNSNSNVAVANTQGSNNNTTINQSGDAFYGSDEAYTTIIDSTYSNVSINQGQSLSATSNNVASAYINNSYNDTVSISQDGDNGQAYVTLDDAWSNNVNVDQDNTVGGVGNVADVNLESVSDNNSVNVYQNGEGNSTDVDLLNSSSNGVGVSQDGTSNAASVYLASTNNSTVSVNQTGNGNVANATVIGVNGGSIGINQAN
jgi:hypothetical protein